MKRLLVAFAVLAAVALGAITFSSAARLDLGSARISTSSLAPRCVDEVSVAPGAATGSVTTVVLTGLTDACKDASVSVTLMRSDGTPLSSMSGSRLPEITNGRATVTVPAFTVADVAVVGATLNTWGVRTSWVPPAKVPLVSCAIPGRPDVACVVTRTNSDSWSSGFGFSMSITTTPAVPAADWEVTVNLADGYLPQPIRSISSEMRLKSGTTCASLPLVTLRGPEWSTKTDANGKAGPFYIGGYTDTTGTLLKCP